MDNGVELLGYLNGLYRSVILCSSNTASYEAQAF
jgi:hypothetical protein